MKDNEMKMDHSKMDHSKMDHDMSGMDHSKMDHDMFGMDHSKMNHDMSGMDHSKMNHDMSGMDHSHMGHDMSGMDHSHMHHGMEGMEHMGNLKAKLITSIILGIPVMLLSPIMGLDMSFHLSFPGSSWLVVILSTILYFYGGWPFIGGAYEELKRKKPAMMTLIAMGITVAYGYSVYAFINNDILHQMPHVMDFFFELASLIIIMLIGHWLEMNSVMKAGDALSQLQKLLPDMAHVIHEGNRMHDMPINTIQKGWNVLVKAGESIPADGVIISGTSRVNESLVTGEPNAVSKKIGDSVIGGTINGDGTLTVQVTQESGQGFLAQVSDLVLTAQASKSKSETLASKVAGWLFYAALTIGILAFVIWLPIAGLTQAASILVTVLVIACPHALGLAIPLVVSRSTAISAANGLLIRQREAIEKSKQIDTAVFDKTGTLTEGVFAVKSLRSLADSYTDEQVVGIFASLETSSSHPIAKSIVDYAHEQNVELPAATDVETIKGVGLKGSIAGQEYLIANRKYLEGQSVTFVQEDFDALAKQGMTVSFLLAQNRVIGIVGVGDQIKESSKFLIDELHARNIKTVMLTGDNPSTAAKIAGELGIDDFKAELLPADKQTIIADYQKAGHKLMMVGDGVNDAPSLAMADIGIAIGAGTDVAIDAADVVLVRSDPKDIINFLNLARATNRKMVQNLWWGAGYNILALPLSAGILAPIGIMLNPAVGAVLMSMSTIIVAINAMALKIKRV